MVKAFYASELLYPPTTLLVKTSILALYVRIFGPLRYLRNLAYGFGIFVACWAVMGTLVLVFQCHPVQYIWDKSIHGTCIDQWAFFIAGCTPNVATDFVILILPLPAVWNLQMGVAQRLSIIGIFMLGSL